MLLNSVSDFQMIFHFMDTFRNLKNFYFLSLSFPMFLFDPPENTKQGFLMFSE